MIDKLKKLYQDQFYGFVVRMIVVYGVWRVLLKASQVIEPFKNLWGKMSDEAFRNKRCLQSYSS